MNLTHTYDYNTVNKNLMTLNLNDQYALGQDVARE